MGARAGGNSIGPGYPRSRFWLRRFIDFCGSADIFLWWLASALPEEGFASACTILEEVHVFRSRPQDITANTLSAGVSICTPLAVRIGCHMTSERYHIVEDCATRGTMDGRLIEPANPVWLECPGAIQKWGDYLVTLRRIVQFGTGNRRDTYLEFWVCGLLSMRLAPPHRKPLGKSARTHQSNLPSSEPEARAKSPRTKLARMLNPANMGVPWCNSCIDSKVKVEKVV